MANTPEILAILNATGFNQLSMDFEAIYVATHLFPANAFRKHFPNEGSNHHILRTVY